MKRRYFGTDGIRGQSNIYPMTPDLAMRVGIAAGTIFHRGSHRHQVVIGKDTRLSGYMLENAMVAGFTAAGVDAFVLGPIPTPAVAMLTRSLRADIGVMISASHNPYEDNGIKLFGPDGYKLSDDLETKIEDLLEKDMTAHLAKSENIGRAKRVDGVHDRYIEHAKRTLPRDVTLQGLRIAIDCANGAAYKVAPAVLWELGADVVTIGNEPNGTNINLNCGSTSPVALQKKVDEVRADIGIALDGDADRVIIVDETGTIIDGDQLMAVIAGAGPRASAARQRHRRHRDVQSRSGTLPGRQGHGTCPHSGRRPLCRRAYASAQLQCRRGAVRPYRALRLRHDWRRPRGGAARFWLRSSAPASQSAKSAAVSNRCRNCCAMSAFPAASRWRTIRCARRSPMPKMSWPATAALSSALLAPSR